MTISKDLLQELLDLETSLHRPEIRRSRAHVERLLAFEFVEFGRSGRAYDRRSIIEALVSEASDSNDTLPLVSDIGGILLAEDCVLLTYRSSRISVEYSIETLRSSIWKRIDGTWRMVFHQGTPA